MHLIRFFVEDKRYSEQEVRDWADKNGIELGPMKQTPKGRKKWFEVIGEMPKGTWLLDGAHNKVKGEPFLRGEQEPYYLYNSKAVRSSIENKHSLPPPGHIIAAAEYPRRGARCRIFKLCREPHFSNHPNCQGCPAIEECRREDMYLG